MEIKIYQIDSKFETCKYVFRDYECAKRNGFTLDDYDLVYTWIPDVTDHCTDWMILDDVFYIFNQKRPEDFEGHSLSVSDVVEFNGKKFYCDDIGWEEIK